MSIAETTPEHLAELLSQVAHKDNEAFAQLYHLTAPNLLGVLMRMVKRRDVAEDALQEAFVQVWNKASEYRQDIAAPMAWMATIARYRALDILRRESRKEAKHSDVDIESLTQLSVNPDIATHYSDVGELERCLSTLTDEARNCIVRSYVEGYTHEELSEELSKPLGTVKTWVRRGLLKLRECMGV